MCVCVSFLCFFLSRALGFRIADVFEFSECGIEYPRLGLNLTRKGADHDAILPLQFGHARFVRFPALAQVHGSLDQTGQAAIAIYHLPLGQDGLFRLDAHFQPRHKSGLGFVSWIEQFGGAGVDEGLEIVLDTVSIFTTSYDGMPRIGTLCNLGKVARSPIDSGLLVAEPRAGLVRINLGHQPLFGVPCVCAKYLGEDFFFIARKIMISIRHEKARPVGSRSGSTRVRGLIVCECVDRIRNFT